MLLHMRTTSSGLRMQERRDQEVDTSGLTRKKGFVQMSFGINDSNGGSPFGTLGIAFFICIGGALMLVRECSAVLGMPW